MILSGILHTSLGGFTVIRGVAPLGDLARCSRFDGAYQRNLIETHRSEIEQFLADRQFLFFPEVVLSASVQLSGRRDPTDWRDKGFRANSDGIALKVVKTRLPQGYNVVGGNPAPTIAYLTLTPEQLERANGYRLFRIDGNHRLSAVDGQADTHQNYRLPTPFCVVLHDDATEAKRFEKVVFHNINAKQIPLTSEENLRLILQDGEGALFSGEDLLTKPSFGATYWLARHLLPQFNADFLGGLAEHFKNKHTLALGVAQFLAAKQMVAGDPDQARLRPEVERMRQALISVNAYYSAAGGQALRASGCHGVLTAFLYFALKNEGRQLPPFVRWIESNRIDRLSPATTTRGLGYHYHLGRTQAVDAASLVDVFESVLTARQRQIFISMAFREEANETFETIKKTVRQINEKHHLDIRLREIRIDQFNKGHSYTIDDEILKVIEGCGLLIADLTFGNRNVYHEIGYLMGLNRGKGLAQDNFVLIADKKTRGHELETDIGFNLKSWQQLRFDSTRQLEEALTESIEIFYGLRGIGA